MEMQPGKGDAQVAQYSPVQTVPTASDSRLRHLALLCDHADIAPRSIFFPPPLPPLNRPASGHLERTVVLPPPPLPSSVPVAGSFEIAWFGFRFPRFCSFATLEPPCRRDSPPLEPLPLATTVIFFHPTS